MKTCFENSGGILRPFNGNLFNLRKGSRNEESFDRHDF